MNVMCIYVAYKLFNRKMCKEKRHGFYIMGTINVWKFSKHGLAFYDSHSVHRANNFKLIQYSKWHTFSGQMANTGISMLRHLLQANHSLAPVNRINQEHLGFPPMIELSSQI